MLQHFIFALLHLVCDGLTTLMYVSTVHNVEVFVWTSFYYLKVESTTVVAFYIIQHSSNAHPYHKYYPILFQHYFTLQFFFQTPKAGLWNSSKIELAKTVNCSLVCAFWHSICLPTTTACNICTLHLQKFFPGFQFWTLWLENAFLLDFFAHGPTKKIFARPRATWDVLRPTAACNSSTAWFFEYFELWMCFAPQKRAAFGHFKYKKKIRIVRKWDLRHSRVRFSNDKRFFGPQ